MRRKRRRRGRRHSWIRPSSWWRWLFRKRMCQRCFIMRTVKQIRAGELFYCIRKVR